MKPEKIMPELHNILFDIVEKEIQSFDEYKKDAESLDNKYSHLISEIHSPLRNISVPNLREIS